MNRRRILSLAGSMMFCLIALLALLAVADRPTRAQGDTLYVALGGHCGNAAPCYATVQEAVDAASEGDTVKVAQGVYTGTDTVVVYLSKGLTVSGGYTVTNWINPKPETHPTVLDAEDRPRRRGVFVDGTNVGPIRLEGLTIRRGFAQDFSGGGVYILTGTVTLQECRILDSRATGSPGFGGGLYARGGTLNLTGNVVQGNNSEKRGGGVGIENSVVTLYDNVIRDNMGSGLYLLDSQATVEGNVVEENSGWEGGGITLDGGSVTLSHNLIVSNTASSHGGGLWALASEGTILLTANSILSNTVVGWSDGMGGGVLAYAEAPGELILRENRIAFNRTAYTGGGVEACGAQVEGNQILDNFAGFGGGGLSFGAGCATPTGASRRNIIRGNTAGEYGGGFLVTNAQVEAENDILASNASQYEGVAVLSGSLDARHWTLAANGDYALTTSGGSAALANTIVVSHTLAGFSGAGLVADHTLFFANGADCDGGASCTHSLSGDPDFVSPAAGDYHIGPNSAAIDAGIDAGVLVDIDGQPRFGIPDLGADEYWVPGALHRVYLPAVLGNYP